MEAFVQTTVSAQGVATVTFYHPSHNALPLRILDELAQQITEIGQDPRAKVVVLKSGGERTFCAGANFDELKAIETEAQGQAFFSGFAKVINACRTSPLMVVGRVQGKAIGGGVGLAAVADYCLATQAASVKLSELMIGIGPFVVGPVIERKIGIAAFSQLTLNATQFYDAQWAKEKGLYAEVYENIEVMDAAVEALAKQLAAYHPEALRAIKKVFWQGTDHWETLLYQRAAISGQLVLSAFTKNALHPKTS